MRKSLIFTIALLLCGCSHTYSNHSIIENRNTDYLKAKSIPPLTIPSNLSSSKIQAEYPATETHLPYDTQPISLIPPELEPGK